jgi:hypothetical protein
MAITTTIKSALTASYGLNVWHAVAGLCWMIIYGRMAMGRNAWVICF